MDLASKQPQKEVPYAHAPMRRAWTLGGLGAWGLWGLGRQRVWAKPSLLHPTSFFPPPFYHPKQAPYARPYAMTLGYVGASGPSSLPPPSPLLPPPSSFYQPNPIRDPMRAVKLMALS